MSRISNCRTTSFLSTGYRSPLMAPLSDALPPITLPSAWTYVHNPYYPANGGLLNIPVKCNLKTQRSVSHSYVFNGDHGAARAFADYYNGDGDHFSTNTDYSIYNRGGIDITPTTSIGVNVDYNGPGHGSGLTQNGTAVIIGGVNVPSIPFYAPFSNPNPFSWDIEKGCYRVDVVATLATPANLIISANPLLQDSPGFNIADSRAVSGTVSYSFNLYLRSTCNWGVNWRLDNGNTNWIDTQTEVSITLTWFGFT